MDKVYNHGLLQLKPLSVERIKNSKINIEEMLKGVSKLESVPRRLVLELTNACNLDCITCGRKTNFTPNYFSLDFLKPLDKIIQKIEEVVLFGWGEPTIHKDFEYFLDFFSKRNVRIYFVTNGKNLNDIRELIFKYKIELLGISVDGACDTTHNRIRKGSDFNQLIANVKSLIDYKREMLFEVPYVNFIMTLMKSNIRELPKLVQIAHSSYVPEIKGIYFTAFEEGMKTESLWNQQTMVKQIFDRASSVATRYNINLKLPVIQGEDPSADKSHKNCIAPWRDLFIGADGFVRLCQSNLEKIIHIENIKSFDELWNHDIFIKTRQKINTENSQMEHCDLCYQSSFANWNKYHAFFNM